MALTGLRTNWLHGSYTDDRDYQIKLSENRGLANNHDDLTYLNALSDTIAHSVTVGYGYDLRQNLATLQNDLANYVTPNSDLAMVYRLDDRYFTQGNPDGYTSLDALVTAVNQKHEKGSGLAF